jgi:polyribonucleotide nucleotidyltransferase
MKKGKIEELVNDKVEKRMRENVLTKGVRIDGRKTDEIRPIECKVGLLPRPHGTGLFQRGETQVLSVATLGAPGDAQVVDTMDTDEKKRYMHHYNFPPYAVGDIKPLRAASRREIGHGDLAERALLPVLPSKDEFPYTIWVVSETLSCNGSSSMASVCGSTLALMHAGVKLTRPVAGIAMGLISRDGDVTKGYKILTDIQGIEDFSGDMDFKVTGTTEGITALQMDIKVKGLSLGLLREALEQAKKARLFILDEMKKAIAVESPTLSKYAPLITTIRIDPEKIREVIGKGGETIQKIVAECGVEIDIEQDGLVFITAPNQENGNKAIEWINKITYVPEVGDVFDGKVTRLMNFGAFVEFLPGKEGLVHISQLSHKRVERVEDVVKIGDPLKVKLMEIDDQGRLNFSHKATLPREAMPPRPQGPRPTAGM